MRETVQNIRAHLPSRREWNAHHRQSPNASRLRSVRVLPARSLRVREREREREREKKEGREREREREREGGGARGEEATALRKRARRFETQAFHEKHNRTCPLNRCGRKSSLPRCSAPPSPAEASCRSAVPSRCSGAPVRVRCESERMKGGRRRESRSALEARKRVHGRDECVAPPREHHRLTQIVLLSAS